MSKSSHLAPPSSLPPESAPAYTTGAGEHHGTSEPSNSTEDEYAILREVDSVLVCDDSGSMKPKQFGETDKGRFVEMQSALEALVPKLVEYDTDGIDLYWLNNGQNNGKNLKTEADVSLLFSNIKCQGMTPIGRVLKGILTEYWETYRNNKKKKKDTKPINIIVITDGAASDFDVLETTIFQSMLNIHLEKALHYQVSIFMFQMGNPEKIRGTPYYPLYLKMATDATKFLTYLDDNLGTKFLEFLEDQQNNTRDSQRITQIQKLHNTIRDMLDDKEGLKTYDIVDTVKLEQGKGETLTAEGIKKVLLGGLRKSMDAKSRNLHQ
ncbi:hypothetical protein F5Y18DRAFT_366949 [Xylariaceae sp. FL1019]|nr:hypothetical protein F5Y18DRAFT_366949 [Xylariaceae sp. FL1019]